MASVSVAALVALAVFGLAGARGPRGGRPAPALPTQRLGGAPATLSSMLAGDGGRPALVVFWASWCGPCSQEAPALERFSRSPAGRSRIVGVDWSDGLSGARAFVKRYRLTFPNVRDGDGSVGNAYHMTDLPTTFVVNGRGRIDTVLRGPQDEASLARALAAAERG